MKTKTTVIKRVDELTEGDWFWMSAEPMHPADVWEVAHNEPCGDRLRIIYLLGTETQEMATLLLRSDRLVDLRHKPDHPCITEGG